MAVVKIHKNCSSLTLYVTTVPQAFERNSGVFQTLICNSLRHCYKIIKTISFWNDKRCLGSLDVLVLAEIIPGSAKHEQCKFKSCHNS